ncbi:leucyl aminopeptidase [Haloglycomyces albus]|uniref:leucyl aminopeptidase n=1 Tax=Haloglycomyces albus TaxID=526067 RepID=UPI00046CCFDD|nr:leucyl aminopeptidase [Haloglycomyces albus]
MTELRFDSAAAQEAAVDVVIIGAYSSDESVPVIPESASGVNAAFGGELSARLAEIGHEGSASTVAKLPAPDGLAANSLFVVGLGAQDDVDTEVLRRAVATGVRATFGRDTVAVAVEGDDEAVATGASLGTYKFDDFKTDEADDVPPQSVTVLGTTAEVVSRVEALTAGVFAARDWLNTPANYLRPPMFATEIERAADELGLEVETLDVEALKTGGYGGTLAVGGGSEAGPRLVRIMYRPDGADKHIALVGKGITFDTGGISLKPPQGMWDMKGDMGGAGAVVGAILSIARLGLPINVTATVALAENMPSGSAYRPGDVVTARNGKTIEVLNTDAEGRMVLSDALSRAAEDEPDALYDVATLTGGAVISLGARTMGLMGTPAETARVQRLGDETGERGWAMPFPEDVKKNMESSIADVSQCAQGMKRDGHMLQGGIFLSHFVPEALPWAHLDIAGPADSDSAFGYLVKGGTGFPVRTLVAVVEDWLAEQS